MNIKEALLEVGKYAPCPHDCLDTNLGNGKVWARCEDCGQTIQQESVDRLRAAHDKFMLAMDIITNHVRGVENEKV